MRVIAGSARGLRLKAPEGLSTRPMTDRVKESLFGTLDSLGYPQPGDRVLDLYAGTGSLGIEALSRGAAWCDFVEQNAGAARIITANLTFTRLAAGATVHVLAAEAYLRLRSAGRRAADGDPPRGKGKKYDIIFVDPPYADPAIGTTLERLGGAGYLAPEGVLVVGHARAVELPEELRDLRRVRHRVLGASAFSLYRHAAALVSSDGEAATPNAPDLEADPAEADAPREDPDAHEAPSPA